MEEKNKGYRIKKWGVWYYTILDLNTDLIYRDDSGKVKFFRNQKETQDYIDNVLLSGEVKDE